MVGDGSEVEADLILRDSDLGLAFICPRDKTKKFGIDWAKHHETRTQYALNVLVGHHSRMRSGFLSNALRLPRVGRDESAATDKAQALIEFLGLKAVAGTKVSDLPIGTQKRVELARALASDPTLLLLDEPASGLNHEEVGVLGAVIRDIRERLGVTILLVEHHMNLVMSISDLVVALDFGRKIAEGTPDEVRAHPEVIQAYLGSAH